jgi:transposase
LFESGDWSLRKSRKHFRRRPDGTKRDTTHLSPAEDRGRTLRDGGVGVVSRSPEQREFVVQPQHWKIERTFGWLDWSRILSKEYERTTESSESDIYLASIRLMLRRLGSSTT